MLATTMGHRFARLALVVVCQGFRTALDEETCTYQLKSQLVLNLITTRLPLALAAHSSTIPVVLAASCFSGSSPAQRSALHGQETCVQLDSLAK